MSGKKLSGLFINCDAAQCSIYESGKMAFQCLTDSDKYTLDYVEITPDQRSIKTGYDFYFFNYHIVTMAWLDPAQIKRLLPGLKLTIVLEVAPNDPFVYCTPDDFDGYIVLDPTLNVEQKNVFAFPRPLEVFAGGAPFQPKEIPVIGSFGFGTIGKGFEHLIDAVGKEYDRAVLKINIPYATHGDNSQKNVTQAVYDWKNNVKDGIEVIVTHDYMTKPELIEWCRQNTINCFFYDRNMAGLSATTDQAITSGRPMLISKNNTFRHIQKYIKPFPYQTIKEAIENTPAQIAEIQKDWSPEKFRRRFEEVLDELEFGETPQADSPTVELPLKKSSNEFFKRIKSKVRVRTRLRRIGKAIGLSGENGKTANNSYSQFGEDVIVRDLLKDLAVQNASYLDIGANNPQFFSNTYLFYENGFSGILVEPNAALCEKLKAERPRDTVLNAGIGFNDDVKEAEFYQFPEDSDGLSTFSENEARYWGETGMNGVKFKFDKIIKVPLRNINEVIAENFTECPDFVSIDVEGWDLKILKTLDFEKYSPAVFCVETLAYKKDGSTYRIGEIAEFFESKGYFSFAETEANNIFVNKNLYDFYIYQKNHGYKSVRARETAKIS